MPVHHVITIQVASGKAAEFIEAFRVVQASAYAEQGCEQYDLFQSVEDPDTLVLRERWSSQELLERHMAAERSRADSPVNALVALWAPGSTPRIERYET